jgi:1-acyl-sn-glycerol-3-phosphate acyltransferase
MGWARALAFNFAFFAWTAILAMIGLPLLAAPRSATMWLGRFWARGALAMLRVLVGLNYEIRGRDRLPNGACIVAMKHQSAWDTVIVPLVLGDPAIVLKRELLLIPFFGWCLARVGSIAIDRKAHAGALRAMVGAARPIAAARRQIVIFPEGTRVAPGKRRPYQPGVAALYRALALPVVPVAVNSGLFWGRRSFVKRSGRIILEFLEPLPVGWSRRRFMATLEERTETVSAKLLREGLSETTVSSTSELRPEIRLKGSAGNP